MTPNQPADVRTSAQSSAAADRRYPVQVRATFVRLSRGGATT